MPFQKMPNEATVIQILEEEQDVTKAADRIGVSRQRLNQFLLERGYERYCIWRKRKIVNVKAASSAKTEPAEVA